MRRALLLLLLVTFAVPLLADVPLPDGNGLSGNTVLTVRAASDGDGQLVVFDEQDGLVIHHVDRNGVVTRRGSIDGGRPSVEGLTATSDGYLMVYSTPYVLRMALLAPDGTLRSDVQMELPGSSARLDVRRGSGTILVASNFGDAVLIDERGAALSPVFHFVPAGQTYTYSVSVAANSDGFLIAWTDTMGGVRTRFVSGGGTMAPAAVEPGEDYAAAVASNGTSFLVVWAAAEQLHGRVFGADGTPSSERLILDADEVFPGPGVVWNGSEYVVVYSGRELRVNAQGVVLGRRALPAGMDHIQRTASGALFWIDGAPCFFGGKVMMRLHETDAAVPISLGDPEHSSAALAPLGERFVVAWSEKTDRTRLLVATTDGQSFSSSHVLSENGTSMPVITNHLLLWTESNAACERVLKGAILGVNGAVVRTMDITDDIASKPAVAWSGFEYAVVWERRSLSQLVGVRIDADGFVHEVPVPLSEATQRSSFVNDARIGLSLAWDGLGYVLVWERYYGTEYPFYHDAPPQIDVRRQFFTTTLSRVTYPAVLEQTGREPALAIGPRLGLTVWRVAEVPYVLLQLFDRNSLVVLAQQALAVNGTPVVVAADNHFAVAVGARVFRVSARGQVTEQPAAGGDVLALSVRDETAAIVYRKDGRGVLRVWTLEGAGPRRQSVRH
jgi:hypothetical protein